MSDPQVQGVFSSSLSSFRSSERVMKAQTSQIFTMLMSAEAPHARRSTFSRLGSHPSVFLCNYHPEGP